MLVNENSYVKVVIICAERTRAHKRKDCRITQTQAQTLPHIVHCTCTLHRLRHIRRDARKLKGMQTIHTCGASGGVREASAVRANRPQDRIVVTAQEAVVDALGGPQGGQPASTAARRRGSHVPDTPSSAANRLGRLQGAADEANGRSARTGKMAPHHNNMGFGPWVPPLS